MKRPQRIFVAASDFLNLSDRCDRCGAQAFCLALIKGTRLLFCNHHFRKHYPAIGKVAQVLVDESYKLEA